MSAEITVVVGNYEGEALLGDLLGSLDGQKRPATATIVVNEDGLSGYWPFDEADGDVAVDATGRGNDGTIYGAVRTAGVHGGATGRWPTRRPERTSRARRSALPGRAFHRASG